jgi:hypothetical protein
VTVAGVSAGVEPRVEKIHKDAEGTDKNENMNFENSDGSSRGRFSEYARGWSVGVQESKQEVT